LVYPECDDKFNSSPEHLEEKRDSRATTLNDLSTVLLAEYQEERNRRDLRQAIHFQMEALKLGSFSEKSYLLSWSNLVVA